MLKKLAVSGLYIVFVISLIFVFAHTQYPGKKGGAWLSSYLKKNYRVDLGFKDTELKIPFKFRVIKPVISYRNFDDLRFESLEVRPKILSLLTGKLGAEIAINGFNGEIKADILLKLGNPKEFFRINLEAGGVDLEAASKAFKSEVELKGNASGRAEVIYENKNGEFRSSLIFSEFSAKSAFIPVSLDAFKISGCDLKGKIEKDNLFIEDANIKSQAGISSITGKIRPLKPIVRSTLSLKGKVVPNLAFLSKKKNDASLAMVYAMIKGKTKLEYSINGNLKKPRIRLN